MAKRSEVSQDDFERMLNWLDADQGVAGRKYETIRTALIRIFMSRGCHLAEELADDTIDRVTSKIQALAPSYQGKPELYFYGVANKVLLEFLRKPKPVEISPVLVADKAAPEKQKSEEIADCLEECLGRLGAAQHNLVLRYYQYENHQKREARQKLADELKFSINALRIKTTRTRTVLRKCISACAESKSR